MKREFLFVFRSLGFGLSYQRLFQGCCFTRWIQNMNMSWIIILYADMVPCLILFFLACLIPVHLLLFRLLVLSQLLFQILSAASASIFISSTAQYGSLIAPLLPLSRWLFILLKSCMYLCYCPTAAVCVSLTSILM